MRSVLPGPRQPEPTPADPWGEEKAVHGGSLSELNNPLRFRRPLDQGCESLSLTAHRWGKIDIDRGPNGPRVEGFELFQRLMDEPRYEGRLFGDISAVTRPTAQNRFLPLSSGVWSGIRG